MSNSKDDRKSTNSKRSAPTRHRRSPKKQRCLIASKKFTAHQFKQFRKVRGALIREMRLDRGLSQADLGAPSQIRLFEQGKAAQIGTMEILVRLAPCPRDILKIFKNMLQNIPVFCAGCRKVCAYKGQDEQKMMETLLEDITDFRF